MPGVHLIKKIIVLFSVSLLLMTACIPQAATEEPAAVVKAIHTAAAKTVVASIPTATETPRPTITLQPSITPMPSFTPNPATLLTPLATSFTAADSYCDNLTLVKNVTVNPGDVFQPGKNFVATWRVLNSGTCSWQPGYKLVHILSNHLGGGTAVVKNTVGPTGMISLSINMTAPTKPGTYTGYWRMMNLYGALMGDVLSVSITVPKATSTPAATPTTFILTNHTVAPGDTCDSIAHTYDTTREFIKSINPGIANLCKKIEDDSIVGTVIKVPEP